jgi:hypothetical protein
MKWLNKLFKPKNQALEPILGDTQEELEEGKHIIHIIMHEKEVTLAFSETEFRNALKRGEKLNNIPREE